MFGADAEEISHRAQLGKTRQRVLNREGVGYFGRCEDGSTGQDPSEGTERPRPLPPVRTTSRSTGQDPPEGTKKGLPSCSCKLCRGASPDASRSGTEALETPGSLSENLENRTLMAQIGAGSRRFFHRICVICGPPTHFPTKRQAQRAGPKAPELGKNDP
jgi:hypothetical protein